jgi:cholesterol oxidase
MDYDVAIIGSGFGGSVSALRLSEKGYRVAVIEQGNRVTAEDVEEGNKDLRRLTWLPPLGFTGYFCQDFFRHVTLVRGIGVGGGSIVYAAVLLRPPDPFFADNAWSQLGVDWKQELSPFYQTAETMLGVCANPHSDLQDIYLRQTADRMGAGSTFGPTPNGIYFGKPEVLLPDPYFKGAGPHRAGCFLCGQCLTGCPHGSKNSLDKNYLFLAEKLGATILPFRKVTGITPQATGGFALEMQSPIEKRRAYPPIRAAKVILAAGVLGTLELLFHCRNVSGTLPAVSNQLGNVVRTNSEAIVGVLSPEPSVDLTSGTAISSHFYPDSHTHVTQNRFPAGYEYMKYFYGPLVDERRPAIRSLKTLAAMAADPMSAWRGWREENWHKRITVLTVMQHIDNRIRFEYRPKASHFFGRGLVSRNVPGQSAPTWLPVANQAARTLADTIGGRPLNLLTESVGATSTTAHILGGCHMGRSSETGVIDTNHRVFGYPDLYVIDGSSVSANIGANPSLTITALAERAISLIPPKT